MARNKRRLRNRRPKNDMREAFAICLNQRRHDALGNRLPGHTSDEITAMGPGEREKVRQAGWLGEKSKRRG
jgi:hypothetical protein